MAIKESALSLITSIAQGDWVRAVTSAGASRRVTVANLAKAIVESYTGSSLAGSAQSVKSAIDSLNSKHSLIAVSGKSFSFNTGGQSNTSWLIIGCSGTVATFCLLVSIASGNVVINEIVDTYGLTWTATLSGSTATITCSASLTTNIKVLGL